MSKTTLEKAIEALRELEKDKAIIGVHITKKFITDKLIALEEVNSIINNENLSHDNRNKRR